MFETKVVRDVFHIFNYFVTNKRFSLSQDYVFLRWIFIFEEDGLLDDWKNSVLFFNFDYINKWIKFICQIAIEILHQ